MQESDHTICFLSFLDEKIMQDVMEKLEMKLLKGNMVRVKPSSMGLSEIIVDGTKANTEHNESVKTFPNAKIDTEQTPAFLNENPHLVSSLEV